MGIKLRTIRTGMPHPYPYEIKCLNCEDWTPAVNMYRLSDRTEYFVCVFCGWETDDEYIIDVAEIDKYRELYEAQKEDIKFYQDLGNDI